MSEAQAWIARAWRDGVGPDDHAALATLEVSGPDLRVFAALATLAVADRVELPPAPHDPADRCVHAALQIALGVRARDRAAIAAGVDAIRLALDELPDTDPHAAAAQAWADLALGEVAVVVGDLRVARQRFEAVATPAGAPVAIRIDAMRHLVGLGVERGDLPAARTWAAKAIGLADRSDRPLQAGQLRRYALFLGYATNDPAAMQEALVDLERTDPEGARVGRLLVAATADTISEALDASIVSGDTLLTALCLVVGVRRYLEAGQLEAAIELGERGVRHLRTAAPQLVPILEQILTRQGSFPAT